MFVRILGGMNAVGTLWIMGLVLLINSDVIGREFFQAPVRGTSELVELSIVGIVFMQLGHTLMVNRMTRSELIIGALLRNTRRAGHLLQGLFNLAGAVLLGVIFWGSIAPFIDAVEIGDYVGAAGDFTAPTWPIRLIILVGSFVTMLQYLVFCGRDIGVVLGRAE